jgi:hypothetical protein
MSLLHISATRERSSGQTYYLGDHCTVLPGDGPFVAETFTSDIRFT